MRTLTTAVTLGGLLFVAGCTESRGRPTPQPEPPPARIVTPADRATGVDTATELALTGPAVAQARVTLVDASGAAVDGALRLDRSAWVPAGQLKYNSAYVATVSAAGRSSKVAFRTMSKPGTLVRVSTPLTDGQVYGVGLPIVVHFDSGVAAVQRVNVERRFSVTSEPAQVGAWHWFSDTEVHYRPKEHWQPGTKLSVRLGTGGLPLRAGAYGAADVTLDATIGEKIVMVTDNATKTLTVLHNDQNVRTIPVSLGKPRTPTSSGAMVIMTKAEAELFVSDDPSDYYRVMVYWTMRTTSGGEYIHAAPWSVGAQGWSNVSHGCTNVSTENAQWLFNFVHVGDPVFVQGTEQHLEWGNGWTDWDRPWEEYVRGSALSGRS